MKLKCRLGFHNMNGCKCIDCLEVIHDYFSNSCRCARCQIRVHQIEDGKCKKCGMEANEAIRETQNMETEKKARRDREIEKKARRHMETEKKARRNAEINEIWKGNHASVIMDALLLGIENSVEQNFTLRLDRTAVQCKEKWGMSKQECIEWVKTMENISEHEFHSLYNGTK